MSSSRGMDPSMLTWQHLDAYNTCNVELFVLSTLKFFHAIRHQSISWLTFRELSHRFLFQNIKIVEPPVFAVKLDRIWDRNGENSWSLLALWYSYEWMHNWYLRSEDCWQEGNGWGAIPRESSRVVKWERGTPAWQLLSTTIAVPTACFPSPPYIHCETRC